MQITDLVALAKKYHRILLITVLISSSIKRRRERRVERKYNEKM